MGIYHQPIFMHPKLSLLSIIILIEVAGCTKYDPGTPAAGEHVAISESFDLAKLFFYSDSAKPSPVTVDSIAFYKNGPSGLQLTYALSTNPGLSNSWRTVAWNSGPDESVSFPVSQAVLDPSQLVQQADSSMFYQIDSFRSDSTVFYVARHYTPTTTYLYDYWPIINFVANKRARIAGYFLNMREQTDTPFTHVMNYYLSSLQYENAYILYKY